MDTRRIMVALDGSAMAEAALPVAESLASRTETTFILVRAADALDAAEKYLETVATALTTRGFEKVETLPMYGPAAAAILEAARTHEPGLIVMATRGRTARSCSQVSRRRLFAARRRPCSSSVRVIRRGGRRTGVASPASVNASLSPGRGHDDDCPECSDDATK
jgi:hypothetical protein